MTEWLEKLSTGIALAVVGAIGGFMTWVVRRLLTNQKEIEILRSELQARDTLRQESRKAFEETQKDIRELRRDIHSLLTHNGGQQ